jgi:deoxycytidylate deaminase
MITNRDLKYFKIAKDISRLSDFKQTKIGAILVYKKDILSVGFNSNKTSPIQKRFNQYREFDNPENAIHKVHAEISCIDKIPYYAYENEFDLGKATIYIYREHKNTHTYACSFPCPACMEAIKQAKIGRIVSTIENGITEIKL